MIKICFFEKDFFDNKFNNKDKDKNQKNGQELEFQNGHYNLDNLDNQEKNLSLVGFEIKNHGRDIVCSAVSILSLNTVNSLEQFTEVDFDVEYNQDGGFLKCIINEKPCEKVELLLNSLELGIKGIEMEYSKDISLKYKNL